MPAQLGELIQKRTAEALARGALQPIPTECERVMDGGIGFLVRVVKNLARKEQAKRREPSSIKKNPFLPYDQDLFVTDLTPTHVGLLNKFNVMTHHLLMVTRRFESQETLLTPADFQAAATCLAQVDGLVFYNGGEAAGASQPHKHLQMVLLPLGPEEDPPFPLDPVLAAMPFSRLLEQTPKLPFPHRAAKREAGLGRPSEETIEEMVEAYRRMLRAFDLIGPDGQTQAAPYNLLVTRKWMLVVPRVEEKFQSISVNALGFAGTLLVRDRAQLELVKANGPLRILQHVAAVRD